ncbi:MAG TPA: acyl-CoA dehydrogenase family protein [Candidatus Limnocylindrales bacterium]|nr:acyl-CoA dehydrogenase family protein [Candidatus Limnocylindrales bacterium]
MDFGLTATQVELAALTRRILSSDRPHWKELAAALDEPLDLPEHCAVLIEIGRAASPVPYLPTLFVTGSESVAPWFWIVPEAQEVLLPSGERVAAPDLEIEWRTFADGSQQGTLRLDTDAAHELMRRATVGVCAQQLGVLERALEMTAAYACERVQFGRPIGTFQAVAQRLADAFIDVEAVRLTMWQAALSFSPTDIAVAKFWAADAGHRVAHTAVHIHGGVGIDLDSPVHRYFVMAKRLEFALGHATESLLAIPL